MLIYSYALLNIVIFYIYKYLYMFLVSDEFLIPLCLRDNLLRKFHTERCFLKLNITQFGNKKP